MTHYPPSPRPTGTDARGTSRSGRALGVAAAGCLVLFVAVLTAVCVLGGTDPVDTAAYQEALAVRLPALTRAALIVTSLGTFPVLVAVALVTAAALWLRTRRVEQSALMLAGLIAVAGLVFVLKVAVGRARPPSAFVVGSTSWDFAFPSGHTANGTVAWVLAAILLGAGLRPWLRRAVVALAVVVAGAIGLSRLYLGYHWMTDVVAGWLIAAAVICLTLLLGRFLRSTRFGSVVPSAPAQPVPPTTDARSVPAG